jgi:hypothetical protein
MTTTDYLIDSALVLLVLLQVRERELTMRALVRPIVIVGIAVAEYMRGVPTAGNDLVLVALLATVGLTSGVLSGLATHVRLTEDGAAAARVGWIAGVLLVAGIGSRMVFAVAVTHGFGPTVAHFSIAHHVTAAAWTVALVAMAILEVTLRQVIVHYRGYRLLAAATAAPALA